MKAKFRRSVCLSVIAMAMGLLGAPAALAGTAEEISGLPTLDSLNRSENPLSNGGRWAKLNWAGSPGAVSTSGWYSPSAHPAIGGAYWTPSVSSDRYGAAASLKMQNGPGNNIGRHIAIWLGMPEPGSAKSGYQLSWTTNSNLTSYTVELSKWVSGTETILASNPSVAIPAGSTLAISDSGGALTAWLDTGGGALTSLLTASDATFSSGSAGVEASGNGSRSLDFKAGSLMGAATSAVPVLDNLERNENPIGTATGTWTKTSWADNSGAAYKTSGPGYGGIGLTGTTGTYWNVAQANDSKGGTLVSAAVGKGATAAGHYLGLWLDMPNPGSERSGYEARFTGVDGTATNYKAEIAKWVGGTRTVLASKEGVSLATGTTIALTGSAGGLTLFSGTGELVPLLTASDTTYAGGYAGLEVGGGAGTLYNFRAGSLAQAPATTITSGPSGTTVPHVSFRFDPSEVGATFECSMDGAPYYACTSFEPFSGLSDGSHTFRVRAVNAHGADPTPALRTFQTSGVAPSKVPVLDAFERSEVPLATGQWTKTSWAGEIGGSWWGYYRGYGSNGGVASTFWNAATFSDTAGSVLAAATIGTGSPSSSEHLALLLNLQSPGSERSGYEARLTGVPGSANTYKLEIAKWIAGARTVLASKEGVVLPPDTVIALAETETHLTFWKGTGGSFTSQLSVTDTGTARFASGNAGLEVKGGAGTLFQFRAGNIDLVPPNTFLFGGPANGSTVQPESVSFPFFAETGATFECSLDGAPYSACTTPKAYPEISSGSHTFRVRAIDRAGNIDETPAERSFTVARKPGATTDPASGVKSGQATLNATVNPNQYATTYQFEYGTSTSYGSVVPATAASAGSGSSAVPVSEAVTGLTPDTEYHFRISATNAQGTTKGADRTFTTTAAPVVTTDPASSVEALKATLNGTINPKGAETTYYFEYGPTTAYGSKFPATAKSAGSGRSVVSVGEAVEGLNEGTEYHYRLVAVNDVATVTGSDQSFTTPFLPEAITEGPEAVEANDAILTGSIDPNGEETTYQFEYGTTTSYGSTVSLGGMEAGSSAQPVDVIAAPTYLEPETTYHYRVVAESEAGKDFGADQTVTTAARVMTPQEEAAHAAQDDAYTLGAATLPEDFVGLMWSGDERIESDPAEMEVIKNSGAKTLRWSITPNLLATEKGWDQTDSVFREAAEREIRILPNLGGFQDFMLGSPEEVKTKKENYAKFLTEVVQRYGPSGSLWNEGVAKPKPVIWWEVGNEENYFEWNPTKEVNPQQFGEYIAYTNAVLDQVSEPDAKVVLGGLISMHHKNVVNGVTKQLRVEEFVKQMQTGRNAYDALGLHPYVFYSDGHEPRNLVQVKDVRDKVRAFIAEARNALDTTSQAGKQIWITELGWPTEEPTDGGHPHVTEANQRDLIKYTFSMIMNRATQYKIRNVLYYNYRDHPESNTPGTFWYQWAYQCGLRKENGAFRLSWHAFRKQAFKDDNFPRNPGAKTKGRNAKAKKSTVFAEVNPEGLSTTYYFQWGPTASPTTIHRTGDKPAGYKESFTTVSDEITGLTPEQDYRYRVVAVNANNMVETGQWEEFETPPSSSTSNTVERVLHGGLNSHVWVEGWVKEGDILGPGPGLANVHVHVKIFRNGVFQQFVDVMTDSQGHYDSGYIPVGKGTLETRTDFPGGLEWDPSSSDTETFTTRDGVLIKAKHSGNCMDVENGAGGNGVRVLQSGCHGEANQVFTLRPKGTGEQLEIIARHSGKCVDVGNASTADGQQIIQHDCNSGGNQAFREAWWGSTPYTSYVAQHSNKCLDVANGALGLAAYQQWTCNGVEQQRFSLTPVESGPIPTEVTVDIDQVLHGSPGTVSFHGHLKAGPYNMANRTVHVEFDNAAVAGWSTMFDRTATANSAGYYEYRDYGLNPGNYNIRANFPGNGEFKSSLSPYTHNRVVKRGYQLINRYSGKCLSLSENKNVNTQRLLQWDCAPPTNGNGQVFSFWEPMGSNWYQLRVNGTNRCVDVAGASQSNGAQIQLYDCLGAGQTNQHWRREPIAGQPGWYGLMPRHAYLPHIPSYKCMDMSPVTSNGVVAVQWDCHWAGHQQWELRGVIDP